MVACNREISMSPVTVLFLAFCFAFLSWDETLGNDAGQESSASEQTESERNTAALVSCFGMHIAVHSDVPDLIAGADHPFSSTIQANCVSALFHLAITEGNETARQFLIERKLDYVTWQAKSRAAFYFPRLLKHDLDTLLPIATDALNAPYPKVRERIVSALGSLVRTAHLWDDPETGESTPPPDLSETLIVSMPETTLDQIVDMVVTKALFDDDEEVRRVAQYMIFHGGFVEPNEFRLRSVVRACERAVQHDVISSQERVRMLVDWRFAVHGGERRELPRDEGGEGPVENDNPFD